MHRIPPAQEAFGRRGFLAASAAGATLMWSAAFSEEGDPQTSGHQISQRGFPMTDLQRKEKLLECLGGPWSEPCPLNPQLLETIPGDGYRIESLTYEAEPGDPIPAVLLVPDGVDAERPAPAVAVWHQHNGQWHLGKSEPAGLAGDPMHHTGVALVREGYVVLCPDALCFEQRQHETLKGGNFERFEFLRYVVAGKCMAWKNILDMRRAIDYLCSRPEVRADRIGCYGHSMGSTHTWLVGPWEPRLKCLVGNCCLPTYAAIHRAHLLHCFPNFIPGWFQYGDTPDIAALIAPRALHLNFGEDDGGSPIQEVREGVAQIARAYADAGAADRFSYFIEPGVGHVLSDPMWRRTRECFARHLRD
jgi:dienelactone hydrolase